MVGLPSIIALGFLLGMRHATDADHVVAVAAIVSRERTMKVAARIGALWGVGHTVTILCVGAPLVLLKWAMPPRLGLAMELSVGLMLILLGTLNVTGTIRRFTLQGTHTHGPCAAATGRLAHTLRPLVVGIVHGLAGSAAVALLVLTTIRQPRWAMAYLAVFGVGTVAGMVLVTLVIALPFASAPATTAATHRRLQVATGLLSVAFGCFIAYKIGVVDGVFGANPHWMPQ